MSEEIVSIFFIPITREANVETKQIFKFKKKKKNFTTKTTEKKKPMKKKNTSKCQTAKFQSVKYSYVWLTLHSWII